MYLIADAGGGVSGTTASVNFVGVQGSPTGCQDPSGRRKSFSGKTKGQLAGSAAWDSERKGGSNRENGAGIRRTDLSGLSPNFIISDTKSDRDDESTGHFRVRSKTKGRKTAVPRGSMHDGSKNSEPIYLKSWNLL